MNRLLLLIALPLAAHDLYLMPSNFFPSKGEQIAVAVHNGDGFPQSEDAAAPDRLRDATLYSSKAAYNILNFKAQGLAVVGDARVKETGTLLLALRTTPNSIEMDAAAFHKYLKHEGWDSVIDWRAKNGQDGARGRERYTKFAKSLIQSGAPDGNFSRQAGFTVEFVPVQNPYEAKRGSSLPVRLLLRGQPAAGVLVTLSSAAAQGRAVHTTLGRTDLQGIINVPLHSVARYRLHAIVLEQ